MVNQCRRAELSAKGFSASRNRLMGLPVAGPSVPLAEAARRRPRGLPPTPDGAKSGRVCLGGRGHAPAGARQARPDFVMSPKSGGEGEMHLAGWHLAYADEFQLPSSAVSTFLNASIATAYAW